MFNKKTLFFFLLLSLYNLSFPAEALNTNESTCGNGTVAPGGPVVTVDQRKPLIVTEYGEISVIDIEDGTRGPYHIQFFTLEPNSLFLPVVLHADMVLYVHTGSGTLSWVEENDDDLHTVSLRRGDIFRVKAGSVFYLQSELEPEPEKLRINAIFANSDQDDSRLESSIGAYSSISDMVRGFDKKTLQAAFNVPEEVIELVTNTTKSLVIVHAVPTKEENSWQFEAARFLKTFVGGIKENKKMKSTSPYNLLKAEPDFQNCNGWSLTVTKRDSHLLKHINIGILMVNLTKGSMLAPHWNPKATEISVVLHGSGMVRVVCPSIGKNNTNCKNTRFRVQEGDVFSVTRYHPMAQISFNNDSFVFMGFSTTTGKNHPQFLAGKKTVLKTLNRDILAVSFNVTKPTIDKILAPQAESVILDCTSCAEEEERLMVEEIEKEKEEEAAKRREEEEKRRKEEEEARKREEEEKRKREKEEERKREEEEKRREEEEAKKREEEEARKREEEEARKREEEKRREEEEEREREREQKGGGGDEEAEWEQEEARRQEEERRRRRREEEQGGGGGGGPEKLDAEARSEEQIIEGQRAYLKLWR